MSAVYREGLSLLACCGDLPTMYVSQVLGLQVTCLAFPWVLGIKTQAFVLCSKHFMHQAISPVPAVNF